MPTRRAHALVSSALDRAGLGSTIARNSVLVMAAEMASRAINLLLNIALYRYLLPEGAGVLRFVMSYGVLMALLTEMGLTRAAILQTARAPEDLPRLLGRIAALRSIMAAVFLAVTALSLVTPLGASIDPQTKLLIWIWSCGLTCQAFRRNTDVVFHGLQRMTPAAVLILFNRLLAVLGIAVVVLTDSGILGVFIAYFAADLIDTLTASRVVRRKFARPDYRVDRASVLALFAASVPFGLHLVANQIYYYIDTIMLKYLFVADAAAVKREIGYYASSYQVVLTLVFIPVTVCNAVFAPLVQAWKDSDTARMRSLFNHSMLLLIAAGPPLAAGFYLFRTEFVLLLFGKEYLPAVPMLGIVVWTLPVLFLCTPQSNLLAATGRQTFVTVTAFASAGFNIALNWMLLPGMGGVGAAITTLASEAFVLAGFLWWVLRCHRAVYDAAVLGRALAIQILAVALVLLLGSVETPVALRAAALLFYGGGCAAAIRALLLRRRKA